MPVKTFPLCIGTPDGLLFEGEAERVVCRSITGDLAILAGHSNFCTALGMGEAHVVLPDGTRRNAACIGGMLSMMNGTCRLLATTWEWEEDIDQERAAAAKKRAEEMLAKGGLSDKDYKVANARLRRALVRLSVKQ
jgi:F-type H+-transporting ATPase subunit epsilon